MKHTWLKIGETIKQRFDPFPLELKPRLRVLLQSATTKWWEIKGEVVSVRQNGCSGIVHMDSSSDFMWNRRFMKIDPTWEYTDQLSADIQLSFSLKVGGLSLAGEAPWTIFWFFYDNQLQKDIGTQT